MNELLRNIYRKAGLDPAIIFTLIGKVVSSGGGLLTLFLVTRFLDKNEQGYYYTFSSILSVQVFFELGLTPIITQYVAHEAAHLSWSGNQLHGEEYFLSRLASIVRLSVKWFLAVSILLFVALLCAGWYFFSSYHAELNISWQSPWIVLSVATSMILLIDLVFAIMEGLGKIREIARCRLIQQACNLTLVSLFLLMNMRLLSGGLALCLSSLVTAGLIYYSGFWSIFRNVWEYHITKRINYRTEIFPYQFRIAIGYISSYFIFQLINPVLFATQGPVVAGQMGATQAVLNGILMLALSWATTKIALYSNLVARRDYKQLNQTFSKTLRISVCVAVAGFTTFVILVWLLKSYFPKLGDRFLDLTPLVLLSLTQLASVIGSSQGIYLRSFKREPFFIPSVVIGILSGLSTVVFSKYFGVTEISIGYFIVNGVVGFAWGCIIFNRYRHHPSSMLSDQSGS